MPNWRPGGPTPAPATQAEARFTVVMDNVGEAVVVAALDGTILSFNRAAEDMFGYDAADMVTRRRTAKTAERGARLRAALRGLRPRPAMPAPGPYPWRRRCGTMATSSSN